MRTQQTVLVSSVFHLDELDWTSDCNRAGYMIGFVKGVLKLNHKSRELSEEGNFGRHAKVGISRLIATLAG